MALRFTQPLTQMSKTVDEMERIWVEAVMLSFYALARTEESHENFTHSS
jgi:hypothetical protein